jgi:hypothetical protein
VLVDRLPKEAFTPRILGMYWTKKAAIVVCLDEETRNGGPGYSPFIREVGGLVPGTCGNTGRYRQRLRSLNRGFDRNNWRVYEP